MLHALTKGIARNLLFVISWFRIDFSFDFFFDTVSYKNVELFEFLQNSITL